MNTGDVAQSLAGLNLYRSKPADLGRDNCPFIYYGYVRTADRLFMGCKPSPGKVNHGKPAPSQGIAAEEIPEEFHHVAYRSVAPEDAITDGLSPRIPH